MQGSSHLFPFVDAMNLIHPVSLLQQVIVGSHINTKPLVKPMSTYH